MIIQTENKFDEVLEVLSTSKLIAFDFESEPDGQHPDIENEDASLHHKTMTIEGLALRSETLEPIYIPFKDTEISRIYLVEGLKKLFSQDESLFIAHGMSFDAKIADYFIGARPKCKFCTLVGYWYLDENAPKDKVTLGRKLFDMNTISYKEAKKLGPETFIEYTLRDAEFAYQLYLYEKPLLEEQGYYELVSSLEMDFTSTLIDMTLFGTLCDLEYLKKGEVILTSKAIELEAKIHKEFGEFNIGSPQQLCEKIYGIKVKRSKKEGLSLTKVEDYSPKKYAPVVKWNLDKDNKNKKTTPSTGEKALSGLDTPAANLIKEYRGIMKLLNTYAIGYQKWVIDGRIWPSFNHVGTVTGRLSSEKPNMQNISHDATEGWWLREAISAPEGYDLIVADEAQLEIRIMAHFSKDMNLMSAIWSGEDVHEATAHIIFHRNEVTKEERRFAKTMNFSISYGQGIPAIAEILKVSNEEAKQFRKKYFDTFPGVRDYVFNVGNRVLKYGYVKTILGRKRRFPEIPNFLPAYGDSEETIKYKIGQIARIKRQAVNSIIQGSASDVLKVAMVNINKEFKDKNLDEHILLQIHDELVVQSKHECTEEAIEIVKCHMEHPFNNELRVPLLVEPLICKKWSEAKG